MVVLQVVVVVVVVVVGMGWTKEVVVLGAECVVAVHVVELVVGVGAILWTAGVGGGPRGRDGRLGRG